ncbi:MAG: NADPH:quinone reductase [Actinomycetota bacterium]|nr:MAG: NADPH:quinone reductase [Actinomycetota bacterium]
MMAAYITSLGPADNIEVGPLPVPVPGPRDALVRVEAVAVNHVDTFIRSGAYRTEIPFPFIIGRDLVGTIVMIGDNVLGFATGDKVWCNSLGYHGRQGSFAEYSVVPSERLFPLPAGVDPLNAVASLHTAATAYIGLFREAQLALGDTVVVGGAGGGVGSAVVQLAAASGARVIATAHRADFEWCQRCGADEIIDYNDSNYLACISEIAPSGVDVFWDNSGNHDFARTLPLLAHRGKIIVTAGLGQRPSLPVGDLYTRDASLRGFAISNASIDDLAAAARTINRQLDNRRLQSRIGAQLPLADAANAHRMQEGLQDSRPRGRIIVVI